MCISFAQQVVLVNLEVIAEVSTNSVGRLLPPNDEVIESFLLTTEVGAICVCVYHRYKESG